MTRQTSERTDFLTTSPEEVAFIKKKKSIFK